MTVGFCIQVCLAAASDPTTEPTLIALSVSFYLAAVFRFVTRKLAYMTGSTDQRLNRLTGRKMLLSCRISEWSQAFIQLSMQN